MPLAPIDTVLNPSLLQQAQLALGEPLERVQAVAGTFKVPDESFKFFVTDARGRPVGVIEWSNPSAPDAAENAASRAAQARQRLGDSLGEPVVVPRLLGRFGGRSASVAPYHAAWPQQPLRQRLQHRRLVPEVLQWWREAVQHSARPATPDEREREFVQPLQALARHRALDGALRDAAAQALADLEAGLWQPALALWHGDLWAGNLLRPRAGARRGFAVIDWGGSRSAGHGIYDLLRLASSFQLHPSRLAQELHHHAGALGCAPFYVRNHALAALGWLSMHLGAWPLEGFVGVCRESLRQLDAAQSWPPLVDSDAIVTPPPPPAVRMGAPPSFPPYDRAADADVPVFLKFAAAEGDEGRRRLETMVAEARTLGWRQALERAQGADRAFMRYICDPARARFLKLLPLAPHSDVLEIGPGLGQFTRIVAPRVRSVSALEVVEGQARFVALSCAQDGLDNVRVACGGDDCTLPYRDAGFDVVILSLVLEWCGDRNGVAGHQQMQQRLLGEAARVLRPGGVLYVSTKNRYALRYLLGKRDEHVHNLRFGNALPRAWMNALLRRRGLPRPHGLLHSPRALAAMLRSAGFGTLESYWAAPEVRCPSHIVPADARAIAQLRREQKLRQGDSRSTHLVMSLLPAAWVRHVAHGLVFVARRD